MNGHQRMRAALEGRQPDCVPVMLHNFMMAADEAGYTQAQFRSDPAAMVRSFSLAVERYRYDGILVDMDTAVLAGAIGVPVAFRDDEPAVVSGRLLERIEDVGSLPKARVEQHRPVAVLLEAVSRLSREYRGTVHVRGNCDQGPFSLATMIRGQSEFMMDLCDEANVPAAEELLEYCTGISCQLIRLMAETGCDMLSNGDSPAGPDLISPAMYERFALPYERRVVEEAHRLGFPYALHICGDTSRILPRMLDTGADCLELDYQTDAAAAHDLLKDRATFIWNLDPSGVLRLGSAGEVERATAELLELFSDTHRFVLNAGCAIPHGTPPQNIRAMVQTARTIGCRG